MHCRSVALRVILGAALLALPLGAEAANPYKSRNFVQQLAGDLGIDAGSVKSFRKSFCTALTADRYESPEPKIIAQFQDCMSVDLGDAYGLFVFDKPTRKWVEAITLKPDATRGFQIAETVSLGATLRQVVFELPSGTRVVLWYDGGLIGDQAYPLEIARRLDEIGFARLPSARMVDPKVTGQTIYLYR